MLFETTSDQEHANLIGKYYFSRSFILTRHAGSMIFKAEDIATEKSVALKGHKYVIDTAGVTKSHKLVIDTAGVTKSHTLVIDTAHVGKAKVC